MPTAPLKNPAIRSQCGHAMDQPGTTQVALRVRTDDGARGVVYVVLCPKCQEKYADTRLRNHQEVQDWLIGGVVPPKDTKWW